MKVFRILSLGVFLMGMVMFTACGGGTKEATEEATTEAAHGENAAFTSAYVCPMHCEGSGSDAAGTCPTCGMDYVALADHTADDHSH